MFAPITQKFQLLRAGLLIVVASMALMASGCTLDEQPSRDSTAATRWDYCPNLPDVKSEDELPAGYVQHYDCDKGIVCVSIEEVNKHIAEEKRLRQEELAQATALVLGTQSMSEATPTDKTLKAVAYYCNHVNDSGAEVVARLVFEANHASIHPSDMGTGADASFDRVVNLICGHLRDGVRDAPVEPPLEGPVKF